ncbi:MAG: hypothetical protein D6832_06275 [Alphaproteobacteria bacterium]|nr:MAG: hypothetical protein D6832_06275 [Alphaproteobacteria bacterium]
MRIWRVIESILLWPGRKVVERFPGLGAEERRLLYHMVNYIVWLSLFVAFVIWLVITYPPV